MLELLWQPVSAQQTALIALSPCLSTPEPFTAPKAKQFFECCQELVQQGLHSWLILDFSATKTIDAAGLDCLARIAVLASEYDLRLLRLNVESHVELALRRHEGCSYIEIFHHHQQTTFDSLTYWQQVIATTLDTSSRPVHLIHEDYCGDIHNPDLQQQLESE